MSNKNSNVWIGDKDLTRDESFIAISEQEFADSSLLETLGNEEVAESSKGNRRDFLKFLGFGLGAATIAAGCDIPVKRALPYVVKPEEIIPGVANYYASTFVNGSDYAPILVKTREARPIKVEGNAAMGQGGSSARAQASVLDLYDTNRYSEPYVKNDEAWDAMSWADLDKLVMAKLAVASNIRILTNTIMSPTTQAAVDAFTAKYPFTKIVMHDSVSYSGILDANQSDFGDRSIPGYHFDKADVIVGFDADFLGTWVSPTEFCQQYAVGRQVKDVKNPEISKHIQVESGMSLTGSNADNRILVKPSAMGEAIAYLYGKLVGGSASTKGLTDKARKALDKTAASLSVAKGKSLVVSGSNNPAEQMLVNGINNALGNYGSTIDFGSAYLNRAGSDQDVADLVAEMKSGSVDALIVMGTNPAYSHAAKTAFTEAMSKVATKISLAYAKDETAALCDLIAPVHHSLESWGDVQARRGIITMIQPTIQPLFNTRQKEVSLMLWAGSSSTDMYETMQSVWKNIAFPLQSRYASFSSFWNASLHDGGIIVGGGSSASYSGNASAALRNISKSASSELEISFFEPVSVGNGQYSNNPWLQEMPDPVTRTSWGNYLAVPVSFDGHNKMIGLNGLEDGDMVELKIGGKTVTVPVIKQFGQMPGTVSLALGYGRTVSGPAGLNVGVDVNDCITVNNGYAQYYNNSASLSAKVGTEKEYSCVQYHHTYGVTTLKDGVEINADEEALGMAYGLSGYQGALTDRSVIYHSRVDDLKDNLDNLHHKREHAQHLNDQQYYSGFDEVYEMGHHWGMHVDLNSCTGCGACTVACMAENNIPVVGKREVSRHHEMSWLRIDRYYYGDIENPRAVYQPMMCQHCDNAPCENVCPVNATNHSSEGLNQMTYNRCIGTRYCANNCPYKVRRFNWLDYTNSDLFPANQPALTNNDDSIPYGADNLTRMVLNPDVTVRSRGVIEKCSFCVQRIQEGKLTAKTEGRQLRDGDVKSACMTVCATGAITFGDQNDKNSLLAKKLASPLNFIALEEINVRSSVNYTMKVNNHDESLDA